MLMIAAALPPIDLRVQIKRRRREGGLLDKTFPQKKEDCKKERQINFISFRKVWYTKGVPVTCEKLKETDSNCPISTSNKRWLSAPGESAS